MTEQLSTPRITASYLENFVGRVVMLVGKVTQLRGDQATLDSDGTVTVLLDRDAHLANGSTVQVIGKVNPDLSIKVLTSRDLGTGVDHVSLEPSQEFPYTPRVAMVWSSTSMTQPATSSPPDGQGSFTNPWSSGSRCEISNSAPPNSMPSTLPPTRDLYPMVQPGSDGSRPCSADSLMSFSTSSSDLIFGVKLRVGSDGSYPAIRNARRPDIEADSPRVDDRLSIDESLPSFSTSSSDLIFTHNPPLGSSVTPHPLSSPLPPPSETLSPGERGGSLAADQMIPSAQPLTSPLPLYSQVFSVSEPSSMLPFSSLTQPQEEDRWNHTPLSPRYQPAESGPSTIPPTQRDDDSELFASVLDGIARIHVSMRRDEAGRWRIRRTEDEAS
ncbi:replication factor A protein 3-domain-containing protein [Dactylonectria estremocensis]|uniref:Replication factor A protein 3-domain-containing protein n=1 Tax=Dactylonectria estremocensis TaxID=1079267 RepID=A0A9P9JGA5_9HYPO|nr:replication factor A protein 3-domain-containing protein [Dactylonectria estremocensis]